MNLTTEGITVYDSEPWTIEEMNLLADETEEIISKSETYNPS